MSKTHLSSISYWNQFLRYSEEHNLPVNYLAISERLSEYKGEDFIPFSLFKDLVNEIIEASDVPWLGLDFAQQIQVSNHGSLGFAISHGVDLKECLNLIVRYYQTRLQAVQISASTQGNIYELHLSESCEWEPIRSLLYEVMLSTLINVLEFIIGKEVIHCEIHFPFSPPMWEQKYAEFIPCRYSFSHSQAKILIPNKLLSIRSISPNPHTLNLATTQCDLELARLTSAETLQAKIIDLVESTGHFNLTADDVAASLHLSKSTLSRRLKAENTSFSEVINDLKKQRAKMLLLSTQNSIESIALSLDYEDASNFNRSFKRWFNCSPSEFRQHNAMKLIK